MLSRTTLYSFLFFLFLGRSFAFALPRNLAKCGKISLSATYEHEKLPTASATMKPLKLVDIHVNCIRSKSQGAGSKSK